MKKSLMILMCTMLASGALATVDPDPDMLGVYFDTTANINCTTQAPSVPFFAYCIATNITAGEIFGVEFGYEILGGTGSYFRLAEILPSGSLNVGDSSLADSGTYIMGFSSPLPGNGANAIVATWQFLLLAPVSMEIFIGPSTPQSIPDGLPALEIGGVIVPIGVSTGLGNAAATINTECVVSTEEATFGSVKALFR